MSCDLQGKSSWRRSCGRVLSGPAALTLALTLSLWGDVNRAVAQSSSAYTLWEMSCDTRWNNKPKQWVRFYATDTSGSYSTSSRAQAVATSTQQNYRNQGYNVYFGVGRGNTPPTTTPCGSGGSGYVQPKCTNYWAITAYIRNYGTASTGWTYTSLAAANTAAANYRRAGYQSVQVVGPQCKFPGQK